MCDVVIIGGGPAGLFTAARCASAGLDVLALEENITIGEPTHCTGIISLETAELTKISEDIVLRRLTRARLTSPGGVCWDVAWNPEDHEQILTIDRRSFDVGLAADAIAAGARVETASRVDGLVVDEHGVTVLVQGRTIRARAAVLACGVSYRFQRQLGLGLPGSVVHTAQVEVNAEPSDVVEVDFGRNVAPEGFLWRVPVLRDGQHRMKLGCMTRGHADAYLRRFLDRPDVRARLLERPGPSVRRLLPVKPIARTYRTRLLAVGDAGGFTKPTTGGGIFYSLLTASLAAETLVEAFQAGRFDETFLSRYERRWQDRLGQELRVAAWLRQLLARCSDDDIDILVRALTEDDLQAVVHRTARFNWHCDVILALARRPAICSILFRSLLG